MVISSESWMATISSGRKGLSVSSGEIRGNFRQKKKRIMDNASGREKGGGGEKTSN
jgi:hypothetical protein